MTGITSDAGQARAPRVQQQVQPPDANRIGGIGLVLGLLANLLLREGVPVGPGFTLWLLLLCAAVCLLCRSQPSRTRLYITLYATSGIAASLILFLRATPVVALAMWLVLVTSAGMVFLVLGNTALLRTSLSQQLASVGRVPLQAAVGFLALAQRLHVTDHIHNPRLRGLLRGLVLAAPLLLIFSLLFASADAVVDRLLQNLVGGLSADLPERLLIIAVFAWISTGLLAGLFPQYAVKPVATLTTRRWLQLGDEELLVMLGLLAVLFVAFVVLQATYLFGGRDTIEATTGLTLAAYARRGFFEMLWVAGLTLSLLLVLLNTRPNPRVFKPLAALLVGCVLVMVASAGQRLGIYVSEFGLSVDRLTASVVMLWLAVCLLLFLGLLLKNVAHGLACGISHSGLVMAFMLAAGNPAGIVAQVNLGRSVADQASLDVDYLLALGADAVPVIVAQLHSIQRISDQCALGAGLLATWGSAASGAEQSDWRGWNASRANAVAAVAAQRPRLQAMAGRCAYSGWGQ